MTSACVSGTATGTVSDEDKSWFDERGPGDGLISQIRIRPAGYVEQRTIA